MVTKCCVPYLQSKFKYVDERCKVRTCSYFPFYQIERFKKPIFSVHSKHLPFDVPATWRQPMYHETDCYFCLTKVKQIGRHRSVEYANVNSFTKPIPHSPEVPYPIRPMQNAQNDGESSEFSSSDSEEKKTKKPLTQAELNDWIRDFGMSKEMSELMASRMKERGFASSEVKVTSYRTRHERFAKFYSKEDKICFCHDIIGLFAEFGESHDPAEWRLFIDSSKLSLKAVLLHQGNEKPSVPVAHAVDMKETYESMSKFLEVINYKQHGWKICADLKVVAMLTGLQQGYTKYCCFLCKWDSRSRSEHYARQDWPKRLNTTVGQDNVQFKPLVDKDKIILPPLHIKLGLFKNLVKALQRNGNSLAFEHLKKIFPNLSNAKINEGVFVGPQIRKILKDTNFGSTLSADEANAFESFRAVCSGFLGNCKSPDYEEVIANLLKNYEKIGKIFAFCSILLSCLNALYFVQNRRKYVFKNTLPSFSFGFFCK